jgi:hypothetical protein
MRFVRYRSARRQLALARRERGGEIVAPYTPSIRTGKPTLPMPWAPPALGDPSAAPAWQSRRESVCTLPEWWNWDLSFTSHAELRMEQRGVTEVEVRAMLERATGFEPNVVEGRFMIHVRHLQSPWIVIVEPDAEAKLLVVVSVYEVSE